MLGHQPLLLHLLRNCQHVRATASSPREGEQTPVRPVPMANMDLAEGAMSMEHGTTDTAVDRRTPKLSRVLPGTDRQALLTGASKVTRHESRRGGSKELEAHLCSCGIGLTRGCGTDSKLPAQSSLVEDTHHLGHTDCVGPRWGEPEATRSFLYDLSIAAQTRRKGPRN